MNDIDFNEIEHGTEAETKAEAVLKTELKTVLSLSGLHTFSLRDWFQSSAERLRGRQRRFNAKRRATVGEPIMGTHYQGTAEEVQALNAFIKLKRAMSSVQSLLQGALMTHGLTETQFGILEALLHLGPMCQRALGGKLLSSGGNITVVVDNLERRGLVRRERSREDRRLTLVNLTAEGESLIAEIFPAHVRQIQLAFAGLTGDEQSQLERLCRKLGHSLTSPNGEAECAETGTQS